MKIIKDAIKDMESVMKPETVKRVNEEVEKELGKSLIGSSLDDFLKEENIYDDCLKKAKDDIEEENNE